MSRDLGEIDEFLLKIFAIGDAVCERICIDIILFHKNDLSILQILAKQRNNL